MCRKGGKKEFNRDRFCPDLRFFVLSDLFPFSLLFINQKKTDALKSQYLIQKDDGLV